MKAMRLNEWGQPLQLEEIPQPTPARDEVLVRVHAASINPFDTMVQAGYMQGYLSAPLTIGTDFSGEVVETGAEITHVKPGDAVYGLVPMHSGSFAEYLVAKANEVALKPATLSFVEAAAVPLASLAAFQSLFDLGKAQKGERVLIIGAAGSVGSTALQLARDSGMFVYALDIPEKAEFAQGLSPDRFIDCKNERFEEHVQHVDLVLDYVGGDYLARSCKILLFGGRYVTSQMLQSPPPDTAERGVLAIGLGTQARVDHLDDLARRIDAGRLKIFVNCTFPLQEAQAAIEYFQKTTNPGRVVVTINGS